MHFFHTLSCFQFVRKMIIFSLDLFVIMYIELFVFNMFLKRVKFLGFFKNIFVSSIIVIYKIQDILSRPRTSVRLLIVNFYLFLVYEWLC